MSDYQGGGDETEWFKRASDLRFYYDPDLWVWHRRDKLQRARSVQLRVSARKSGTRARVDCWVKPKAPRPRCHEGSGPCGASSL